MDVKIPDDGLETELDQIQKILEQSMADSLKLDPKDCKVKLDPETGEATYLISGDDPILAEETQKVLKTDDFLQNVNKAIGENSENLPERIREVLEIKNVNPDDEITTETRDVNDFFLKLNKIIRSNFFCFVSRLKLKIN